MPIVPDTKDWTWVLQRHEAADRIASRFAGLTLAQWLRTGARSDGARFNVDSFARYLIHDPVHHLHDIGR